MKLKTQIKIAIAGAFVLAEILLYALFLAEDFGGKMIASNVTLKYSTVALALGFVLANLAFNAKDKSNLFDLLLLSLGLALTFVSDWFLLVAGEHFVVGLITFCGAQLCYFARIKRTRIWLVISVTTRVVLSVVGIVVLASLGQLGVLYALVAIYFVQLVANLVENIFAAIVAKDRAERCKAMVLSVGFLLFVGCDICVGLFNLFDGMAGDLIWLFYTPSQVLIALSQRRFYENTSY